MIDELLTNLAVFFAMLETLLTDPVARVSAFLSDLLHVPK